jgi:hypothetical protein
LLLCSSIFKKYQVDPFLKELVAASSWGNLIPGKITPHHRIGLTVLGNSYRGFAFHLYPAWIIDEFGI